VVACPGAGRGRGRAGPPVGFPWVNDRCHIIKDGCIWAIGRLNGGMLGNSRYGVGLAVGGEGSMYWVQRARPPLSWVACLGVLLLGVLVQAAV
jgi:hypothetical protein